MKTVDNPKNTLGGPVSGFFPLRLLGLVDLVVRTASRLMEPQKPPPTAGKNKSRDPG